MDYLNKDIPQGAEESRVIEFPAPGGLDTPVLGTDSKTGQGFFNLGTINSIIREIEDLAQGDTRLYEYRIERDGYLIRSFYSEEVKRHSLGLVPLFIELNHVGTSCIFASMSQVPLVDPLSPMFVRISAASSSATPFDTALTATCSPIGM